MSWRAERRAVAMLCFGLAGALLLFLLQGCGNWKSSAVKTLGAVQALGDKTFKVVAPAYDLKCRAAALKCGNLTCGAYKTCDDQRAKVFAWCRSTQQLVVVGGEVIPLVETMMEGAK